MCEPVQILTRSLLSLHYPAPLLPMFIIPLKQERQSPLSDPPRGQNIPAVLSEAISEEHSPHYFLNQSPAVHIWQSVGLDLLCIIVLCASSITLHPLNIKYDLSLSEYMRCPLLAALILRGF